MLVNVGLPRVRVLMCTTGTAIATKTGDPVVSLVRKGAVGDALMSVGAVTVLIGTLAVFDDRVREQISWRLDPARAPAQVAEAGATVRSLALVIFDAVRDQSIEHAPLVIFVLAATVLVLFMLRT